MGEADGINYNFVSEETFEGMIARGEFLEYARYVDHYYGTSLKNGPGPAPIGGVDQISSISGLLKVGEWGESWTS